MFSSFSLYHRSWRFLPLIGKLLDHYLFNQYYRGIASSNLRKINDIEKNLLCNL